MIEIPLSKGYVAIVDDDCQPEILTQKWYAQVRSTGGRWQARIKTSGRFLSLGVFDSKLEAAKAYDEAALRLYGEFARTNASLGLL